MTNYVRERTAKIIAEMRTRTYIDKFDTKVIEDILNATLKEYYDELNEYYDAGYDDGYAAGHPKSHSAV